MTGVQGLEGAEDTSTGSGHFGVKCCWVAVSLGLMSCVTVLGVCRSNPGCNPWVLAEWHQLNKDLTRRKGGKCDA